MPPASLSPVRILVRGVNWLGDAVMTTPALQRLREAKPAAHIALFTPAKLAEIWTHHPAVDAVIPFAEGESLFSVGRRLRQGRFDIALVLPNSPRSVLEVLFGRIRRRVGYARAWRAWFLTDRVPPRRAEVRMRKRSVGEIRRLCDRAPQPADLRATAHHVHQYLPLVAALGADPDPLPPLISVLPSEVAALEERFRFPAAGPARPLLFGLNAGAAYGSAKRWPADRFIAAARELQQRMPCHWWVFGSRADEEGAAAIAEGIRAADEAPPHSVHLLAGRTSLRELCAALKACDVVLTNDSGPMHLAAAVGTPVVAIFGSTSPELTGPGLPGDSRHAVLRGTAGCAPCFLRTCPIDLRCMTSISVAQVVQAVVGVVSRMPKACR
jgi:heptosyltransferase II